MKSLVLHYTSFKQNIELKTTFQVNKLYNTLTRDYGNYDDILEYDIDKSNKVCISLKDLNAVCSVIDETFEEPPYRLELTFKNGASFTIDIWGEKRARNAYYLFLAQMKKPNLQHFYKIPQTNKKHFSVIRIQDALQFVKLDEPKSDIQPLFEDRKWKLNQI